MNYINGKGRTMKVVLVTIFVMIVGKIAKIQTSYLYWGRRWLYVLSVTSK
jgi:hypothetical protein